MSLMQTSPGGWGVLTEHAVDGGAGDEMALRQLAQTLAPLPISQDGGAIENQRLASDVPAFELGAPHAGADPLDDQVALELGDRADDDDDGAAQRAAGVDLLAEADELDVEPVQLIEHIEEVLHRPGDPIGGPDQDDVELAAAGIAHHVIETRPLGFGSADPVGVLLDDLIAALLGHLAKVVELGLGVLIEGGDPHIEGGALHRGIEHITHI